MKYLVNNINNGLNYFKNLYIIELYVVFFVLFKKNKS